MLTATWLAGEQGFRDFFCLPPVKENRAQPVDPTSPEMVWHLIASSSQESFGKISEAA